MVDWSKAPEGAVDVRKGAHGGGFFTNGKDLYHNHGMWLEMSFKNHSWPVVSILPAPEWPSDNRIDVIGQNGPSGEHYRNKYDRVIHGKYGTGQCTVDVYRVLNAFGPLSPEVQHAAKKLLAAGSRGHKDEKQDLLEAIQSIEARLKYLEDSNA